MFRMESIHESFQVNGNDRETALIRDRCSQATHSIFRLQSSAPPVLSGAPTVHQATR